MQTNVIPVSEHKGRYKKRVATAEENYCEVILFLDDDAPERDDVRRLVMRCLGYNLEF